MDIGRLAQAVEGPAKVKLADRRALGHRPQVSTGIFHLARAFLVRHGDHGGRRAAPAHDAARLAPGVIINEEVGGLLLGYGNKIAPCPIPKVQLPANVTARLSNELNVDAVFV